MLWKVFATLWFTSLSLPDKDSLNLSVWLMENSKEHLKSAGFTDDEIKEPIGYWAYSRRAQALYKGIEEDSIKFDRLFEKVNSVRLLLSEKELEYLRESLTGIGFLEHEKSFSGQNFVVFYELTHAPHNLLKEAEVKLTKKTEEKV